MTEHTPFLTVFPGCAGLAGAAGGLDKAYVTDVRVDSAEGTLTVAAWFAAMPSPVDLQRLAEQQAGPGRVALAVVEDAGLAQHQGIAGILGHGCLEAAALGHAYDACPFRGAKLRIFVLVIHARLLDGAR